MSTCAHGYVAQYVDIVTQEYLRRLCMDVHMDACMDVLTNLYGCLYQMCVWMHAYTCVWLLSLVIYGMMLSTMMILRNEAAEP